MLILVTGAAHPLSDPLAQALIRAGHTVRGTDTVQPTEPAAIADYRAGNLADPAFVAPLLAGVEAIVHLAPLSLVQTMPAEAPGEILDAAARGTHVLLKAAVEGASGTAAPPIVVQGGTLAVMDAYDDDLEVTEQWRPRPQPVAAHLAPYLAELTAREFTRDVQLEAPLRIVCLRFAPFAGDGDSLSSERQLSLADAADAILHALAALQRGGRQRGHRWQLYHVASPSPEARYTSAAAQRALGYATAGNRTLDS
jgi:nucleoside-diphosphate-sugar epimerase